MVWMIDQFRMVTKMMFFGGKEMIHSTFSIGHDGSVTMDMNGHAVREFGSDNAVCAAATMLAYTLWQSLQLLYENNRLLEKPDVRISSGLVHIFARPKEYSAGDVLMAFWVVQAGMFCLSKNYPNDVTLTTMDIPGS